MKRKSFVSAILVCLFILAGCADTTSGVWVNSQGQSRIDNHQLAQDVILENLQTRHIGDLMQGITLITSKASIDLRLQYKFTWFDAQGVAIDEEASPWKSLTLHGMQSIQVNAVAPNPQAQSFEVYLREAHSY
ncbi:YcfL family protein [Shewanella gelidii]|uniref:DUF1425 domain-containing protein n=1 Tax=Shewanella gelidii TaxID=1642821 RepID=A0A917JU97_9GAMM|nr:YcfL family protein [Shewanella gelidii]MCL1098340.1 YcfL family protein [Shewanella gelidii]GGI84492.1 hypothetical protein GCM10009332_22200 [Shewanella gelidii]